jgi:hypothetical protein
MLLFGEGEEKQESKNADLRKRREKSAAGRQGVLGVFVEAGKNFIAKRGMEMKRINLKKWSWMLFVFLLAAPAWGEERITLKSTSPDTVLKDLPDWVSKDAFTGIATLGYLISGSIYPEGSVSSNEVIILGATQSLASLDFVAGGQSSDTAVTGNKVTISMDNDGKINAAVFGGAARVYSADYNSVTIVSGTVGSADNVLLYPGQVYGGYVTSSDSAIEDANADGNTVTIGGGNIRGTVVGGFVQGPIEIPAATAGSGDALYNKVYIQGGTYGTGARNSGIFGGRVGSGDANYNRVVIKAGDSSTPDVTSVDEIVGGYSKFGSADHNIVKILTPITLSDDSSIEGGRSGVSYAQQGKGVSYNVVDIRANVGAKEIHGGVSQGQYAVGNRVRLWGKKDTMIEVKPAKSGTKLDIQAGSAHQVINNTVEIYGNVKIKGGNVNLYGATSHDVEGIEVQGNKLILAVSKDLLPLEIHELRSFSSFDIAVGGYTNASPVLSADTVILSRADNEAWGNVAEFKVYSFNLSNSKLTLISADTKLKGSVKNTAGNSGEEGCFIWGTDPDGHVIRLEVTSGDDRWLAVSSDLTPVASVSDINVVEGSNEGVSPSVTSTDWPNVTITGLRGVGGIFTVESGNTIKLKPDAAAGDTGKVFVDFSNGATAVAPVTVSAASNGGNGNTDDTDTDDTDDTDTGGEDEPDPDPSTPTDTTPGVDVPSETVHVTTDPDDTETAVVEIVVTEEQMADTIEKAIEKAKDDAGAVPTVNIPVTGIDRNQTKVIVALPLDSLNQIVAKVEDGAVPEIDLKIVVSDPDSKADFGEVVLNTDAIRVLIEETGGKTDATVKLVITEGTEKLKKETILKPAQEAALEALETPSDEAEVEVNFHEVFDISLYVENTSITDFKTGELTVGLPYTLKAGEKHENIKVYHIGEDGVKTDMEASPDKAGASGGKTYFKTSHLSVYAVVHETAKTPPTPPADTPNEKGGSNSGGGCDTGLGALAGLILAAACFAAPKGKR